MQERTRTLPRFHAYTIGLLREAIDLLFPISCVGCGTYRGDRRDETEQWLCTYCRERLRPPWPTCVVCGKPSAKGITCPRCSTETPLTGVLAVGQYADPVLRAAIAQLKFHGIRALADALGTLLAGRLTAAGVTSATSLESRASVALVPLPLHARRERWRGFNQAQLIADTMGKHLRVPVRNALVRVRATSPQTTITESPTVRRANVAGAFALCAEVDVSTLSRAVIVDDVLTTGATMTEAAHVLRAAGVPDVWAVVIARG